MPLKYYRSDGQQFIQNGQSKVQVGLMHTLGDPIHQGRVCKIFAVQKVIRQSDYQTLKPGTQYALSFSGDKVNSDEYNWQPGEPTFVKFTIKVHGDPRPRLDDNIDPAML